MSDTPPQHHAILGAGGIGGLIGGLLAAGGERVTAIVREGTAAGYPDRITVQRPDGTEVSGPVDAVTMLSPQTAIDVLWVTTKALQLDDALRSVAGTRPHAVVSLLNGVDHIGILERHFGHAAVFGSTIAVEAERTAPGTIRQGSPFVTLALPTRGRTLLEHATTVLARCGVTSGYEDDERTLLWKKLTFLCPFALTTSASNEPLGFVREHPEWRARFAGIVREAVAAGNADGAHLDSAHPLAIFAGAPAAMRSSMWRDLEAGNEPELDAIAGAVVRAAERHGLGVPVTRDAIARVTARIER